MNTNFKLLIDDGGSHQAGYVAFAGMWADDNTVTEILSLVASLKLKYGIPYFHAKDLNKANLSSLGNCYSELFDGLIKILKNGAKKHLWVRFGTYSESQSNIQTIKRWIEKILANINISTADCTNLSKSISYMLLPILEFINNTKTSQEPNTTIDYYIDQKNEYLDYLKTSYDLETEKNKLNNYPGDKVAHLAINAFLKVYGKTNIQFKNSILADSKIVPEIEVMDAISNFSWNWLKFNISNSYTPSDGEKFKHDVFKKFLFCTEIDQPAYDLIVTDMKSGFTYDGVNLTAKTAERIGLLRLYEQK